MHDDHFPPRGRLPASMTIRGVSIEHADGTETFDHNGIVEFLAMRVEEARALRAVPFVTSVLSGRPALRYRTHDVEIPLTADEIAGLVGTELCPTEYVALRGRFGTFFEIHDDFYDPATGGAFQPKGLRTGFEEAEHGPGGP